MYEDAFGNVVCEMVFILPRLQCVKNNFAMVRQITLLNIGITQAFDIWV